MNNSVFFEQKYIFDIINNESIENRLCHAFLIEKNNYYQTNVLIDELCKILVNFNDDKTKRLIESHNYPDIKYIRADGDNIKKYQIVDIIKEFSETSIYGSNKIYIIEDADKLNGSSANALLKFLEEPARGVFAILVCNSRYSVMETILSRCQILSLLPVSNSSSPSDAFDIELIVKKIFNGFDLFTSYDELLSMMKDRKECANLLKDVEIYLYNVFFNKTDNNLNLQKDKILSVIFVLEDEIPKLKYNLNFKLFLDKLFIRIGEVISL